MSYMRAVRIDVESASDHPRVTHGTLIFPAGETDQMKLRGLATAIVNSMELDLPETFAFGYIEELATKDSRKRWIPKRSASEDSEENTVYLDG